MSFLSHHSATRVLQHAMSTTSALSSTRQRVIITEGPSRGVIAAAHGTCNGSTVSTTEKDKSSFRLEHSRGLADREINDGVDM